MIQVWTLHVLDWVQVAGKALWQGAEITTKATLEGEATTLDVEIQDLEEAKIVASEVAITKTQTTKTFELYKSK